MLRRKGVARFGLHTMVVSNELAEANLLHTAGMMFDLAVEVQDKLGVNIEFIDFGGGIGIPYRPEDKDVDCAVLSAGIRRSFEEIMVPHGPARFALPLNAAVLLRGRTVTSS